MRFCKFNAVSAPQNNKKEKPKFTTKPNKTETRVVKKPRVKQTEKTEKTEKTEITEESKE